MVEAGVKLVGTLSEEPVASIYFATLETVRRIMRKETLQTTLLNGTTLRNYQYRC